MKKITFVNRQAPALNAANLNQLQDNMEEVELSTKDAKTKVAHIPKMIAHRGASAEAPENTIKAIEIAGKQKFWGAECDVQITSDGYFVIMHDNTVDRTTNGTGNVSDMTLAQIKALNIDSGSNISVYNDLKVPTLEEYLDVCYMQEIIPVIELKTNIPVEKISDFYTIIKEKGFENACTVISFSTTLLETLRNLSSTINIQALLPMSEANIDYCQQHNFDIDSDISTATEVLVKYAHNKNVKVNVYTLTSSSTMSPVHLTDINVDYITTDSIYLSYSNTSINKYEYNGFKIYNDNELIEFLCGGTDYSNVAKTILPRGYSGSPPFPTNLTMTKDRFMCMNKLKLKPNSIVEYEIPDGYYFTIHPYASNDKFIQDLGWFSGTSYTNFPNNIAYGIAYFKKSDNGILTEYDKTICRKIITAIKEPCYSTSEIKTNKLWIDNKPIYRKVVPIPVSLFGTGTATCGTTFSYNHGIYNIDKVIEQSVFWKDTNAGSTRTFPGNYFSTNDWDTQSRVESTKITFEVGTAALNRIRTACEYMYAILEYTKTID